jgi:hypothetical protein
MLLNVATDLLWLVQWSTVKASGRQKKPKRRLARVSLLKHTLIA